MQRHSLQSCPVNSGHTGGVLLPENILETSRPGSCRLVCHDSEEWRANRYFDSACKLRGPRLSLWQAASRGWCRFFLTWITYACSIAVVFAAQRTERNCASLSGPLLFCFISRRIAVVITTISSVTIGAIQYH